MGNRAVVVFVDDITKPKQVSPAIHLQLNGGPESIYPFLDELDRRRVRSDVDYACARFIHLVCDFFDQEEAGGTSIGVFKGPARIGWRTLQPFASGDNGVYVVCRKGGQRRVRRFVSTRSGWGGELPGDAVERERQEAYRHQYTSAVYKDNSVTPIAVTFEKLRPEISTST